MVGRAGLGRGGDDDNVSAERLQVANLLDRSLLGHHKDAAVATDCGCEREADACVSGSRFDDRAAGF